MAYFTKNKIKELARLFLYCIPIGVALIFVMPHYSSNSYKKENSKIDYAIRIGEIFIKNYLVSPHSADFGFGLTKAAHLGHKEYYVTGIVDSQNKFGAMVRTNWEIKIQRVCDDAFSEECWQTTVEPTFW